MMTEQQAIEALRKYIKATGKTQVAVAKELNISESRISQFLAGEYRSSAYGYSGGRSVNETAGE